MDKLVIRGGKKLKGSVMISGAGKCRYNSLTFLDTASSTQPITVLGGFR